MFNLFGSKAVADFAIELAKEFHRRCPPELASRSTVTVAKAIDEISNRAGEFQREKKLGIYGRAKMGTEFKVTLRDLGYADAFVDELTTKILFSMSGK